MSRIVFFGSANFALPSLEAVASQCVLVVSQPDKPTGRGMKMTPTPVSARAQELSLPLITPEKCRKQEVLDHLRSLNADLFVVAAYGQILSQKILDIPKQGCINIHGSILPKYRGAAPVQYAVWHGDSESGVTLMRMDAGMDTGDIIAIERVEIGPHETAGELYDRLSELGGSMTKRWLPQLLKGDYEHAKQDDEQATYSPKISKEDAELRFEEPCSFAYNRYRGMTPFPGAWVQTRIGRLKLNRIEPDRFLQTEPGVVAQTHPDLIVGFVGGCLIFDTVQPEGKPKMSGSSWANGARVNVGDTLSVKS